MCDFRLLCPSGSSREFLQATKYLTNIRLFVKKKLFRSRRAPHAYTQMSKLQNMTKSCMKWSYYTDIIHDFVIFRLLCYSGSSREFLQATKYLTSLRLFVKKKLFRSRRAPHAYTQISKNIKYEDSMLKLKEYIAIIHDLCEFSIFVFSGFSREFLQARKYLTSLRWFVKEK